MIHAPFPNVVPNARAEEPMSTPDHLHGEEAARSQDQRHHHAVTAQEQASQQGAIAATTPLDCVHHRALVFLKDVGRRLTLALLRLAKRISADGMPARLKRLLARHQRRNVDRVRRLTVRGKRLKPRKRVRKRTGAIFILAEEG